MNLPYTAKLTVEKYLGGVRVDRFLAKHFRNYTPFRMARIVRAGGVHIEGARADSRQRVFAGQRVEVHLLEPPDKLLDPEPLELNILFEDDWLVVINKPAGLVTHPVGAFQSGTLCNGLQHYFDELTQLRGLLRPGIVHRLDRHTSGLIVATKHHLAHRLLSIQFQRDQISKSYLALVEGDISTKQGDIDLPIGRHSSGNSVLMSAQPTALCPRSAHTRYSVVERLDGHTLVRAHPLTGRNHQIRVHLAAIGHPVVGDEFYGSYGAIKPSRFDTFERSGLPRADLHELGHVPMARHALHAERLGFKHPIHGEAFDFASPLPVDLQTKLHSIRGTDARKLVI